MALRATVNGPAQEEGEMAATDVEQQQLLIAGEWTAASGGGTFERVDPFTGEPVTVAAAAAREDARRACDAAAAAFPEWSQTPPGQRRVLLSKAADLLMEHAPEIASIMTEEVGGTFGWGMFNCDLASRMLREAAAQTYSVTGEVIPSDVPGALAFAVRQPVGVVVGMAPWNAPVILSTRAVATPLAYANTVVLKASERCPRTHGAVVRAIADAGLPAGAINLVTHAADDAPDVVDALIAHPAVRRVNFTGSTKVGRIVALQGAEPLKRWRRGGRQRDRADSPFGRDARDAHLHRGVVRPGRRDRAGRRRRRGRSGCQRHRVRARGVGVRRRRRPRDGDRAADRERDLPRQLL